MKTIIEQLKVTAAHDAARVQGEVQPIVFQKARQLLADYPDQTQAIFIIFSSMIAFEIGEESVRILNNLHKILTHPEGSDIFRILHNNFKAELSFHPFLGHQIYEELKNLIGEEATKKIANRFNGGSFYFPRPKVD